jgi:hypothetical protein
MAAANAVLRTYELLEAIMLHLPPFDMARAMRVSRTWNSLIESSSRIYDLRILAPEDRRKHRHRARSHVDNRSDDSVNLGQIPVYASFESMAGFRYNPNIPWPSGQACQSCAGDEYMGYYLNFGPEVTEHDWRLNKVWKEFATIPPCQAIALRILKEEHYCVVYVRDGVRVKHLREASSGMLETVGTYFGSERRMRAIITGWVYQMSAQDVTSPSCATSHSLEEGKDLADDFT